MTANDTQLLTPAEVASLCRFKTPRPIYAALASGELPSYRIGRDYRITPSDLEAWLASKRTRPVVQQLVAPAVSMRELVDAA